MLRKIDKKQSAVEVRPLLDYLKEQNSILNEIGRLLYSEQAALKSRDADSLDLIAGQKTALMQKLVGNDQKIKLHPDKEKLQTEFKKHVAAIKDKLLECKKRNEVNGRLISICTNANKRLTDVLMRSRDVLTKNLTYTEKGRTTATGPVRLSIDA